MRVIAATMLFLLGIATGCSGGDPDAVHTGTSVQTSTTLNRLTLNRLTLNRLTLNRLTLNRLTLNRLTLNRLTLNRMATPDTMERLEATPEGREVLAYVVRCALDEGDVVVAEHDGVTYELPGLLGLTPAWEHRSLEPSEVRLLSACLLGHVNAYGVSVPISLRAADVLLATDEEIAAYPVFEGTFFGDLFGDELAAYSCSGDLPEAALVHSSYRSLRVCTDGDGDCEIVSMGRCRDVCETYHPRYGWQGCWAEGVRHAETISSYLQHDNADRISGACPAGSRCDFSARGGQSAIFDCADAAGCATTCGRGATCSIDGSGAGELRATVSRALAAISCHETERSAVSCVGGRCDVGCVGATTVAVVASAAARATIDCSDAYECGVVCAGGSQCDIDCSDAGECSARMACVGGAACSLRCDGAESCGFSACEGELEICSDGTVACNRPCS